ncbi:single-strand DNA endonuclease ASTE1-like [Epargyreus clarus]|uniref:single-strand DNA endonuclease ASTE1-like n=1 Tax=Epargyreus clarus TaxID=520877 RepID=UPI003C2AC476
MRIRTFAIVVNDCCQPFELRNSNLVIDAQNFFYHCYKDSNLRYELGAESDRYAKYLRQYLSMFKEANIKCYFIFKGGTENLEKKIEKDRKNPEKAENGTHNPIFMNNIHLQVLDEMEFDYVFSEFQAKTDCIALAKKLCCPVLSMDIEFALSGVPYIPLNSLKFDANQKILNCKLFMLNTLLEKFSIDKDKLAAFILVTDLNIFPEDSFTNFFKRNRMSPFPTYKRNENLLCWLSKNPINKIMHEISSNTTIENERIIEELDKCKNLVNGVVVRSLAIACILREDVENTSWFEKGVALTHIAKPYVDLYRSKTLLVTGNPDEEAENSISVSLNIIKYAYDLLTNFENDGFKFIYNHFDTNFHEQLVDHSISKPTYQANSCVFENGWDNIRYLNLFQHFMIEEVHFDFRTLENAPDDAKMLLMALVYFNHKKSDNTSKIAYSVLLSHVILSVLDENDDVKIVSAADSQLVAKLLKAYFNVTEFELISIKNMKLYHPLLEFQLCLKELNNLNKLCGSPFEPTIYSKTYNGTFVYKIVNSMQNEDELQFINKILEPVPTVFHIVNHLINIYQSLL